VRTLFNPFSRSICVFGKREEFVVNAHISHRIEKIFPIIVNVRKQKEWLVHMDKILFVVVQFPMVHAYITKWAPNRYRINPIVQFKLRIAKRKYEWITIFYWFQ
jgi:hypothetical protein